MGWLEAMGVALGCTFIVWSIEIPLRGYASCGKPAYLFPWTVCGWEVGFMLFPDIFFLCLGGIILVILGFKKGFEK